MPKTYRRHLDSPEVSSRTQSKSFSFPHPASSCTSLMISGLRVQYPVFRVVGATQIFNLLCPVPVQGTYKNMRERLLFAVHNKRFTSSLHHASQHTAGIISRSSSRTKHLPCRLATHPFLLFLATALAIRHTQEVPRQHHKPACEDPL